MGDRQTRHSATPPPRPGFWMSRRGYEPGACLDGDQAADVAIVGAGFTGLWSAIHLKGADPALDVVVVERDIAGYGASGRNGGFAMTMVGRNRSRRLAYALGYAGHGVGPAHLVGRIVADLLLGSRSELLDLPMVSKRPVPLPPGPLRGGLLKIAERVLLRSDDQGSDASPFARLALRVLQ